MKNRVTGLIISELPIKCQTSCHICAAFFSERLLSLVLALIIRTSISVIFHEIAEIILIIHIKLSYNIFKRCRKYTFFNSLILIFAGDEDKYAMLDTRPPTASMGGYGLPPPSRAESSFKHYPEDMDNGPEVINVTANATTTLLPGMYNKFELKFT